MEAVDEVLTIAREADIGAEIYHLKAAGEENWPKMEQVLATIENVSGIYPRVDDTGTALLRFTNGVLATVEASWVQTGGLSGLEITGSEGTLCWCTSRPGPASVTTR